MVWKKGCQSIIILILFSEILLCQNNNSVSIHFKSGKILENEIISIKPWGIELKDNLTLSYKVIDKIIISDKEIADSISKYVGGLSLSKQNNKYLLDFNNANLPKFIVKKDNLLTNKYFLMNLMSNRAENFEFSFNFSPEMFEYLTFQLSYSTGLYTSEKANIISSYNIGLGTEVVLPFGKLRPSLVYGFKSLTETDGRFISPNPKLLSVKESLFLNLGFTNIFISKSFIYSVGTRYYLRNLKVDGEETKFSISFGLGILF